MFSSSVASDAPFDLASSTRWPSVVCLEDLTHLGRCEISLASRMNWKFTAGEAFSLSSVSQACSSETLNNDICEIIRTKPSSVIEQVASCGSALAVSDDSHVSIRKWNSCCFMPKAIRAFTSRRYVLESRQAYLWPFRWSAPERHRLHQLRATLSLSL